MSEVTKFDFDHIFAEPIVETLAYLTYIKEKRRRENLRIKQLRARRNG